MIDLPQVVDIIAHPNGRGFLDRDAKNVATWFAKAGHPDADSETLTRLLAEEARLALGTPKARPPPPRALASRAVAARPG
jgi:serine/threonine-protein kinase RIO1